MLFGDLECFNVDQVYARLYLCVHRKLQVFHRLYINIKLLY